MEMEIETETEIEIEIEIESERERERVPHPNKMCPKRGKQDSHPERSKKGIAQLALHITARIDGQAATPTS